MRTFGLGLQLGMGNIVTRNAGGGGVGGDPYWSNVVSLLHFEGTNGSTSFTDETGKTWTASGNAQITTSDYKFGTSCATFDGTGDYLATPDNSDFDFGTGLLTIDCWIKLPDVVGTHVIIGQWTAAQRAFLLYTSGSQINFAFSSTGSGTTGTATSGSGVLSNGVWHHVAVTRNNDHPLVGDGFQVYVDGVMVANSLVTAASSMHNSTAQLSIGADGTGSSPMLGLIDDARVTKGVCRYSGDFTPPTAPFPAPT